MDYSIIIPIYNEAESLIVLIPALLQSLRALAGTGEIIIVNDGSEDNSLDVLKGEKEFQGNLIVIDLLSHYGKAIALQSGFDLAQGKIIITLDGDLQHDPHDISKLLDKLQEGYDVVCGWRYPRRDPWLKIWSAKIASFLRKSITGEHIHDVGCAFRVFKRATIEHIYLRGGMHRFFTLIMIRLGYRVGEVQIPHYPRRFGKAKYNIHNRLFIGIREFLRFLIGDVRVLLNKRPEYAIREVRRL
jgi:glycosyltransferase involved in cell wall biosynthesis